MRRLSRADRAGPTIMMVLGVGWLGMQVFWAFNTGTMPLFLRDYTDSKFWISVVVSLAGISGCVVAPLIGYLSDRTASRFGRRAPYIVGGMLTTAVCLLVLPNAPTFLAVAGLSAFIYCAINVAQAPNLALLPDVTPPEQRGTASGVLHLGGSLGLIAYFAGAAVLWETNPHMVFTLVALAGIGAALVPVTLIREPVAPPPEPGAGIRAHVRGLTQEIPLLIYFTAMFFCWLGHWMSVTFFTLFLVEELGVGEGASQYAPMVFGVSATAAALPVGILGDRLGRKRVLSWLVGLWIVTATGITFVQTLPHALLAAAVSGVSFAALLAVGYALMLDLIPKERTAEFVGLSAIPVASSQIIGPLVGGVLIDTLGYRSIFPAAACILILALAVLRRVPVPPADLME